MQSNKVWKIIFIGLGIILGVALVVVMTIVVMRWIKRNDDTPLKEKSVYSEKAQAALNSCRGCGKLDDREYSKTVEVFLEEDNLLEDYIDNYYEIEYREVTNFTDNVNKLLEKKYSSEEINYILKNFSQDINILLDMEYVDILKLSGLSNFRMDNLERYLSYGEKNRELDVKTVVTYVNIGLDKPGYQDYETYKLEEMDDITLLVNKYHKIPEGYTPDDLVVLSCGTYKMRKEAAEHYEELVAAGLVDNVIFYPFSTYRSMDTQRGLYNNYKNRDGEAAADTYSARPGHSEHQLGLAVDIRSRTLTSNLTDSDYKWMLENSYKYGFIVRYPKGKQHITQFIEEPWHLRYLGVELATKVKESGLTYDEYYDIYMSDK